MTKSIVDTAPNSQGFSVVARKGVHGLTAYGLGICRQTLDDELCKMCLVDGALSLTSCSPATEGFAMNAGCYFRYSNYTFYNERELLLSMSVSLNSCVFFFQVVISLFIIMTFFMWGRFNERACSAYTGVFYGVCLGYCIWILVWKMHLFGS